MNSTDVNCINWNSVVYDHNFIIKYLNRPDEEAEKITNWSPGLHVLHTYLHTAVALREKAKVDHQHTLFNSVLDNSSQLFPVAVNLFDVCVQFSMQVVLWPSSFPLLFRIPNRHMPHDAGWWLSRHMFQFPFFPVFPSSGSWFAHTHGRLLLMISNQQALGILRRQIFIITWTVLMTIVILKWVYKVKS